LIQYLHKSKQRFFLNLQAFEIDLKLSYTSASVFKTELIWTGFARNYTTEACDSACACYLGAPLQSERRCSHWQASCRPEFINFN